MRKWLILILVLGLLLALCQGCATNYGRYTYKPRPATTRVESPVFEDGSVTLLASVLGIRTGPERGSFIELRIRANNDSGRNISVVQDGLELYSADLNKFHLLYTEPADLARVPAGGAYTFNAAFGFPQGQHGEQTDLSGLSLRWEIEAKGRTVTGTTSFERELREEYRNTDRYWHDPYPFHFSTGWYYIW